MKLGFLFTILFFLAYGPAALAAKITGQISFQGETVHLEFQGRENWIYNIGKSHSKGRQFIDVTVDLVDEKSLSQLAQFKSDLVKSVLINPKGPDGKHVISFEVAGDQVEVFDYLTDQPSRLIVDFYMDPAKTKQVKKSKPVQSPDVTDVSEVKADASEKKENKTVATQLPKKRGVASTDVLILKDQGVQVAQNQNPALKVAQAGIFDGGDPNFDRFSIKDYEIKEEAQIRSKDNYYIQFPMLQADLISWLKVKAANPLYNITPKDNDENKQARLLLTLFEKGRFAVYLKTLQWFKEKYPQSEYDEMISYMTGDVYYKLWEENKRVEDFEMAIERYRSAVQKFSESKLAERTSLMLGFLLADRGDTLGAIRAFNEHIDNKKFDGEKVYSKDLAKVGLALAYMKLRKFKEAVETYNQLEAKTSFKEFKTESAFRRGDVYIQSNDFAQAVKEYKSAIAKYPEAQKEYPSASYNQGEALFQLEKYRDSLDTFREFVRQFPMENHAAFAMTRMGELLEILGADQSRVMGAYLETYFRYGESPNAIVARLRLLSTRMKGMKPKEVDTAVQEIMGLAKKLDLPNIEQFATVMVSDGYTRRGEFSKAVDLLTAYYKGHPNTVDEKQIKKRIIANINDKLRTEVNESKFIDALKTHAQYSDSWLKNSPRLDTKYFLGRAYEMGGAVKEASKYYRDVLNKMYSYKGLPAEKELLVLQYLPNESSLNLRLAATEVTMKNLNSAYDYIKNIKNPESLTESEQIERVNLTVKLLDARGDNDSAVRFLTELLRTWKGIPELVAEPYLSLANLELKMGKPKDAVESLKKIDSLMKDSGKVPGAVHSRALEILGDVYLSNNEQDKAATAYQSLLSQYEEKKPLSSIRYKLGQIYFKKGEIQKASETWNTFKNDKGGFWQRLAQEQLKNSEWRQDYKKYIKRIPAMSENK